MRKILFSVVTLLAVPAFGQCDCGNPVFSSPFGADYDCLEYVDDSDSLPFCIDCRHGLSIGRLIKCEDHLLLPTSGRCGCISSPSTLSPTNSTMKAAPYTARDFHIKLSADSPLMKADFRLKGQGRALFDPLYEAVKAEGVEVERFCMEKGRPVVYSKDNHTTDEFNAEAFFDGTADDQITVHLVLLTFDPGTGKQALADRMIQNIAKRLADAIKGSVEGHT